MAGHVEFDEDRGTWTDRDCAYHVARHVLDEVSAILLDHVTWARGIDPNLAEHFLDLYEMVVDWLNGTRLNDESGNRAITAAWNRLWDDEAALFRKLEAMLAQGSAPEAVTRSCGTGPATFGSRPGQAPAPSAGLHL